MAALLATLVLDEEAMEVLQNRGEGHLVFEVALQLVSGAMGSGVCRSSLACKGRPCTRLQPCMTQVRASGW